MQIPIFDPKHFNGAVELNHLGIVECQGAEACHFLHQQLTQDLLGLAIGSSTLAGFCNAKGRLQASMVVIKESNERLFLIIKKDLLERTLKRLSMFVLRAKVKLFDSTQHFSLIGLCGEPAQIELWKSKGLNLIAPLQKTMSWERSLLAVPKDFDPEKLQSLLTPRTLTTEQWLLSDVLSGVAWVEEKTFEHFVPQMLNFESAGAVSFKKGCYPGQEVVARSQFRGTLKKRTLIVFGSAPLEVGTEIFSRQHATEACGEVLQVSSWQGLKFALACFQIDTLMKAVDPNKTDHSLSEFITRESFWTQCFGLSADMAHPIDLGFYPLPYRLLEDI